MEIVKMSSKGQLVIPQEIRQEMHLKTGERMLLVKETGTLFIKPLSHVSKELEDELFEAKLAAEGWKDIEAGKVKKSTKAAFLKELAAWQSRK